MTTIFTKIIKREIPGYIVAEDENNIAFLDIEPLVKGHTLVVPKKEIDHFLDLAEEDYLSLNLFAKKVAEAIYQVIPCKRIGTAIVGLEVPHTHLHLVPLNQMSDINFSRARLKPTKEEFEKITETISDAYKKIKN